MVASQFSPGRGARWFWEIETNGASAKRCAVNGKSGKSSRPCNVVRNGVRNRRRSGKCTQSIWEWITSNSPAFSATASSSTAQTAEGSERGRLKRRARGQTRTSLALVRESPLANSVTSCPKSTNSSVNHETTRSVPPYNFGGTLSARGAICAMRTFSFPGCIETVRPSIDHADNSKRLIWFMMGSAIDYIGSQAAGPCPTPRFSLCRVPHAVANRWRTLALESTLERRTSLQISLSSGEPCAPPR
jgi:hypothetical protein